MALQSVGEVVLKLSLFSRKPADPCIINDNDPAFAIGTVLVESSEFLPRNRFPEWRVIHAYADRYETPHVILQNVNEPGSRKSLSMPGLVASGKYLLKEPRHLHS
jgi:hypothetical protein